MPLQQVISGSRRRCAPGTGHAAPPVALLRTTLLTGAGQGPQTDTGPGAVVAPLPVTAAWEGTPMSQQPVGGASAPPEVIYIIRHGEKPADPPPVDPGQPPPTPTA